MSERCAVLSPVSAGSGPIDLTVTDPSDLPVAVVRARLQVAALKARQEALALQARELARLIEPFKGTAIDARA
jgi:hypothetical protein